MSEKSIDVRARVVEGANGEVSIYFFADTPGKGWGSVTFDVNECDEEGVPVPASPVCLLSLDQTGMPSQVEEVPDPRVALVAAFRFAKRLNLPEPAASPGEPGQPRKEP